MAEADSTTPMAVVVPEEKTTPLVEKKSIKYSDIANTILYISRGVDLNQPRLVQRAIRQNVTIRKTVTSDLLYEIVNKHIPSDCPTFTFMNEAIKKLPVVVADPMEPSAEEKSSEPSEGMDVEDETIVPVADVLNLPVTSVLPEVEVYIFNLIVTTLLREKLDTDAAYFSTLLIERIRTFNRRSLDILSSKAYFYFSLSYERINRLNNITSTLLVLFRTACVRHDDMGQAVLLNLLLRNYLHYNLVDAAYTLSLRAAFPENASNNQFCRYLYYMGRIQAVQLEYSEAYQRLTMAVRKAPQGYADGFHCMATKLVIIVQLLMGDVPERSVFNQPELRAALLPYLALTQAVRNGDLIQFNSAVEKFADVYKADKNETLIQRLGHNVLKTGLRKISTSYSRISLQDIAAKLHLASASAAEYICAKAIRDGVIEAKINHEQGYLTSHEIADVYSTDEPQIAFHKRIAFCLDIHNEAVKSMRYPPSDDIHKKKDKDGDKPRADELTIDEIIAQFQDDMDGEE